MATGFGKAQPQPKVSKRAKERAKASKQMDQMRADGLPEYEVYIRIQAKEQWYPVGVIAVQSSRQINQAIYGSQEDLLQGAFRIYPVLRKNKDRLEYGYRLKEFKDEEIQVAVEPKVTPISGIQNTLRRVGAATSALFKRS
ncbi:MAG: HHL1-like protein [Cyanobacteria bacterium J06626_23]